MAFERWDNHGVPKVTIRPNGQLIFNKAATVEYGLAEKSACAFWYDAGTMRIGLEFTDTLDTGIAGRLHTHGYMTYLNAGVFMAQIDARPEKSIVYQLSNDRETNLCVIHLKDEPGEVTRGPGKTHWREGTEYGDKRD